jgi:cell division protein FtsQ
MARKPHPPSTGPAPASAGGAARRRTPRAAAQQPLPVDVRVTQLAANVLFALLGLVLVGGLLLWLARAQTFALRGVQLKGDLLRTNVPALRHTVAPRLQGNFFSVNLQEVRSAFETVPWVRRAVVRRVWPDRLDVHLEEHRPAALWMGNDSTASNDRLVNDHGEVFEANASEVDDPVAAQAAAAAGTPTASLPTLAGPEGSAAPMLALYRRLAPLLAGMEQEIETLELTNRGSWRAELRSTAVIELGRGTEDEIVARTTQFVQTVAEATEKWRAPLEVADLRHTDGYAVRLRGISVSAAASGPAGNKTN